VRLIGTVSVPATVISNNGGSLISKTKPYRLRALEQVPVAGALVRCLDAGGRPLLDSDGKPLEARTDATGAYALVAAVPTQALVLTAELPGQQGLLQALAPRTTGPRDRTDIELISTLTSTYILETYVRSQPDPVAALERLPVDVEAQTRQEAAQALGSAPAGLPQRLDTSEVVETVTTLRRQVPALDAQLEAVRKLLIVAGLSDLGNGQAADSVYLGDVRGLQAAPDGSVYFHDRGGIIWRVTAGRRLERVSGVGPAKYDPVEGQNLAEMRLDQFRQLRLDDAGRLWLLPIFNESSLWRVDDDRRTLRKAAAPVSGFEWFLPTTGDRAVAYDDGALWDVEVGRAPSLVRRFTPAERAIVDAHSLRVGRDAQGRLYLLGRNEEQTQQVYRLDPGGDALVLIKSVPEPKQTYSWNTGRFEAVGQDLLLDRAGRLYLNDGADLRIVPPEGDEVVWKGLNLPRWSAYHTNLDMSPDGSLFVVEFQDADQAAIYRVRPGRRELWAGKVSVVSGR
jgi:hypothetical protein